MTKEEYKLYDRVHLNLEICNGTPSCGTIMKITKENGEFLYDIRLDWAISSVGMLIKIKSANLDKI